MVTNRSDVSDLAQGVAEIGIANSLERTILNLKHRNEWADRRTLFCRGAAPARALAAATSGTSAATSGASAATTTRSWAAAKAVRRVLPVDCQNFQARFSIQVNQLELSKPTPSSWSTFVGGVTLESRVLKSPHDQLIGFLGGYVFAFLSLASAASRRAIVKSCG